MDLVWIVDDDPIARMLINKKLQRTGIAHHAEEFENGLEAIDHLRSTTKSESVPDLIILDLNMPILDGWGFLDELEQEKRPIFQKIKVAILTSSIDLHDRNKSENYDCIKSYLSKPMDSDQLMRDLSKG
jgi:CheY-like chemotaxis protein